MPRRSESNREETTSRSRAATTPEVRESQLISLAVDLVEQRLRDGTASAQEVTMMLKLGSSRERLEQERLRRENELLRAKAEELESRKNVEALYKEALDAMRAYSGHAPMHTDEDFDD